MARWPDSSTTSASSVANASISPAKSSPGTVPLPPAVVDGNVSVGGRPATSSLAPGTVMNPTTSRTPSNARDPTLPGSRPAPAPHTAPDSNPNGDVPSRTHHSSDAPPGFAHR